MNEVDILRKRCDEIESAAVASLSKSYDNSNKIDELTNMIESLNRMLLGTEQTIREVVHTLIEFVRQNDIDSLDEEEFALEVQKLLFKNQTEPLPF